MINADHLYGADAHWWHHHIHDINMGFSGKRWSCQPYKDGKRINSNWNTDDPVKWDINILNCLIRGSGLSTDPDFVCSGSNSGYQAINLAYHLGASRIILLGFDMHNHSGKTHWHDGHPDSFPNSKQEPDRFIADFRAIKPADYGIEILNCSRVTALDAFPIHRLEDVI